MREAGSYCCLPPGLHPEGVVYQWTAPPNDDVLTVEPDLAGFLPAMTQKHAEADRSRQRRRLDFDLATLVLDDKAEQIGRSQIEASPSKINSTCRRIRTIGNSITWTN